MLVKNLISFLKTYRYWIAASVVAGLAVGLVAAFLFNPIVVTYRQKNIGSYYTIESLKSAKIEAVGLSHEVISTITNPARAKALKNTIGNSDWVEKNITSAYALVKADMRDLVDSPTQMTSENNNRITYINFTDTSKVIELTIENLKFISYYLLRTSQRDRLSRWVGSLKQSYGKMLAGVLQQQPDVTLLIQANADRIRIVKNLIATNSGSSKGSQLFFSMNQRQDSNSLPLNYENLTTYIPPERQLQGLEINQIYLGTGYKQLQLKKEIFSAVVDRANEAQILIDSKFLANDQNVIDLPQSFWRGGKLEELLKEEAGWRREYTEGLVKGIELSQIQLLSAFDEIARQSELVEYKRKFSRLIAIILGLLAGLMGPLIVFGLTQMSKEENRSSDKA